MAVMIMATTTCTLVSQSYNCNNIVIQAQYYHNLGLVHDYAQNIDVPLLEDSP